MKLIGRKLVMDWGNTVVAIEIYPKEVCPYPLEPESALLYNIIDCLGEKMERLVGKPYSIPFGMAMNECMPASGEWYWKTEEEVTSGGETVEPNEIDGPGGYFDKGAK